MTFYDVLMECAGNRELVAEFDRLNKSNLSFRGSALDLEIDRCTGRLDQDMLDFIVFVKEFIWDYLPGPPRVSVVVG